MARNIARALVTIAQSVVIIDLFGKFSLRKQGNVINNEMNRSDQEVPESWEIH